MRLPIVTMDSAGEQHAAVGLHVCEHGVMEPNAFVEVFDRDMNVHAFHGVSPQQLGRSLAAQVAPAQQFSVRKPIRPVIASKFAV